jgi:hypothetical protein
MTKQSKDIKQSQVTVPFGATPATDPPSIDQWASSMVWTESMLKTLLENKVRGGKWPTLAQRILLRAWALQPGASPRSVRSNHGTLPSGEPYAGKPPVRFGGRGSQFLTLPTSISESTTAES